MDKDGSINYDIESMTEMDNCVALLGNTLPVAFDSVVQEEDIDFD